MEAKEKVVLRDVLHGLKSQFCIPVFQRNYSWNEKNCERLFNDICELINDKERSHFIGSFVYKMVKLVDTQYIQFVLIDGQQRLTSLTLILKALYDYLNSLGEEYQWLCEEINDSYLINRFAKNENLKLKLKPNKEDDKNFTYLMENKLEDMNKTSLIYRNYNYFLERIKKLQSPIEEFYDALQRLEGVSITLDENDNAQMIFESLNSTGLDLNEVDLIRNYLLMNCIPDEQEELYNNYWVKLESILDSSFTDFARDYLSLKIGTVVQTGKNKVYQAFKKYYTTNYTAKGITLKDFLSEWIDYAKAYEMLLKPSDKKEKKYKLENAINDTIMLNMKTTYPFLLGILYDYKKELIDKEDTVKIFRLIESYALRRSICSMQGGALSQIMASIIKELKENYKKEYYTDTYIKIATKMVSINTNAYFPKNDQFKDEFISKDMYNSTLKKYVLYKLENSNQEKEIVYIDNLTIEHIMPNTLNEAWKKYLNIENVEEFHSQYKNRIGNLTLTAYNSEMGQKLFNEKKNNSDFSRLNLNRYFSKIEKWDKEEIIKRSDELFEIALKIWKYPDVLPESKINSDIYNILDDSDELDFSNSKPIKYKFDDFEEEHVNNWTSLFQSLLDLLYNQNKELFISIISQENYCGTSKKMISKNPEDLRYEGKISDGYYIEINNNTSRKIKILKTLIKDMGYDNSTLLVSVVPS